MLLTTDKLAGFVGGQLQEQNATSRFCLRGEISSLEVDVLGTMRVTFAWAAVAVDGDGLASFDPTGGWVEAANLPYGLTVAVDGIMIVHPQLLENGRLVIDATELFDLVVTLFPPGGDDLLDRSHVRPVGQ